MDTAYGAVGLPFRQALSVLATVISASPPSSEIQPPWVVADVGLKSLGMDHGNPTVPGATVWFCSDEHTTFAPDEPRSVKVGDRVRVLPAHVDPTVALHDRPAPGRRGRRSSRPGRSTCAAGEPRRPGDSPGP